VLRLSQGVLKHATAAVLLRTLGLASVTAIIAGASTAGASTINRPMLRPYIALKGEPSIAQREQRSDLTTTAQTIMARSTFCTLDTRAAAEFQPARAADATPPSSRAIRRQSRCDLIACWG